MPTWLILLLSIYLGIAVFINILVGWVFIKANLTDITRPLQWKVEDICFGVFWLGPQVGLSWPKIFFGLFSIIVLDQVEYLIARSKRPQ